MKQRECFMSVAYVLKGAGRCSFYAGSLVLFPLACLSVYPIELILALSASQRTRDEFHANATARVWRSISTMEPLFEDLILNYDNLVLSSEATYLVGMFVGTLLEVPVVFLQTLALAWISGVVMVAAGMALYTLGVCLDYLPPIHPRLPASFRLFSPQPAITRLDDPAFGALSPGL